MGDASKGRCVVRNSSMDLFRQPEAATFPVRGEGFFVRGALSVLRAGWGALPSPGGEGAELARRKGSMVSAGSVA